MKSGTDVEKLSIDGAAQLGVQLYIHVAGVPEIPQRPTIRERPRGVDVKWTGVESASPGGGGNDSGPLVYIVDSRWNIGREENEDEMTGWQQVSQVGVTSQHRRSVCGFGPGNGSTTATNVLRYNILTGTYKKAQLTPGLRATAPSFKDGGCSKMAISCHLGYYRTGNSTIRSADPENPCLTRH